MIFLFIALGGALGSVVRYGIQLGCYRLLGQTFPWGTLTVNLLGAFAIGIAAPFFLSCAPARAAKFYAFFISGMLGGFTTFSAFSMETISLYQQGLFSQAFSYATITVLGGWTATALGVWLSA